MSPDRHNENYRPQDAARTFRSHAGEAIVDSRTWPGYVVIGASFLALALTLAAAGYGFEGWAWIAGIACPILFVIGLILVLLERKRVNALEGRKLTEPGGH